jgi:phage-related protein
MPLTNAYSFSFNGQTFGGAGSPYQILTVDGLESIPTIRNQDDNRGYNDGMFTGRDFLGGRTISIIFNTFGSGATSAQENLNTIQGKLLPQSSGTTPLYFLIPDGTGNEQFVNARVRVFRTTVDVNYTYGYITSQVDFFCADPRYYNSTLNTLSLTVGGGMGRVYNRTYNLVYLNGAPSYTTVTNTGRTDTYPTITFNGPITNPIFGNVTQSKYIFLNGTFVDTDICVINLQNQLITLNGNPARNLMLGGSQWWSASSGANSIFYFGTGIVSGTTAASISWYNAFI